VASAVKRRPPAAGRGRKKGELNKITKTLKEAILLSFDMIGAAEYLAQMAFEEPASYMSLLGRVLPTTLAGDPNAPIQTISRIELVGVEPKRDPADSSS